MELNKKFLDNMKIILGIEFKDFLESFYTIKQKGLRTNTLKIEKSLLKNLLNFETNNISWCKTGLSFNENLRPAKSPLYHAGLFYIQEPSAMITGSILNIEDNDKVLDLCSAPGGKTTQIAQKLNHTGFIVSNDISATRLKAVVKNVELLGIKNSFVISENPDNLAKKFPNYFNKIIVDAPCSGEGMFKRNPDVLKSWNLESNYYYQSIQKNILEQASRLLAPGGEIVYSTCTFSIQENEIVIKDFLDSHVDFSLSKINHEQLGISNGIANNLVNDERLLNSGRIWPHKSIGDGHFVALLKNNNSICKDKFNSLKFEMIKNINYYFDFCDKIFYKYPKENLFLQGINLYSLPTDLFDTNGLRVLRSGLLLGELKNNRFEPSQALAMSMKITDCKNIINFDIEKREVIDYLLGNSFVVDAKEDYNLVCVNNFPLGFGKVQNGRLKNKYQKSWRI